MGTIYARGKKLWMGFKDAEGKWRYEATGLDVGQEAQAKKLLEKVTAKVAAGVRFGDVDLGPVTVRRFVDRWLEERERLGIADWTNDRGRLRKHVLPRIGDMPIADVKPRHLIEVVKAIRAEGKIAPRTVHKIYGTLHVLFRDAVIEELIDTTPCVLTSRQLGPNEDKDPEWRVGAVFTRDELETLISTELVPWDRRVLYALEGIAGVRHGEMAGLRWRNYDAAVQPLGRLVVARSYNKKGTKTHRTRLVPVHPTLAEILAEWKDRGWAEMMGRPPGRDDILIPSREGDLRSRHHSRNKLLDDLQRLGLRPRRGHDLRRTFVTLARADGARKDLLEMVSHNLRGDIVDMYTTMPWAPLCEEVAKLQVKRLAPGCVSPRASTSQVPENTGPLTTVLTTGATSGWPTPGKAWENMTLQLMKKVEAPGVEPGSEDASQGLLRV